MVLELNEQRTQRTYRPRHLHLQRPRLRLSHGICRGRRSKQKNPAMEDGKGGGWRILNYQHVASDRGSWNPTSKSGPEDRPENQQVTFLSFPNIVQDRRRRVVRSPPLHPTHGPCSFYHYGLELASPLLQLRFTAANGGFRCHEA